MKDRLSAILFLLCLAAGPAWSLTWKESRDYHLGPGRAQLMSHCDHGRQYNSLGQSFWDYSKIERLKNVFRSGGKDSNYIEAFLGGQAAAMAKVCPDVK